MLIEEKFLLKAPIQEVWDFLLNPKSIGSCIPGCEEIEAIDGNNFMTTVKVKVGPFSMRFKFKTSIKESNPPFHVKTLGGGDEADRKGNFRQETNIDFKSLSDNETEISYKSEVMVGGRLATFGEKNHEGKG